MIIVVMMRMLLLLLLLLLFLLLLLLFIESYLSFTVLGLHVHDVMVPSEQSFEEGSVLSLLHRGHQGSERLGACSRSHSS